MRENPRDDPFEKIPRFLVDARILRARQLEAFIQEGKGLFPHVRGVRLRESAEAVAQFEGVARESDGPSDERGDLRFGVARLGSWIAWGGHSSKATAVSCSPCPKGSFVDAPHHGPAKLEWLSM